MLRYISGKGSAEGLARALNGFFGYDATYSEAECLVSKRDPNVRHGPAPVLKLDAEIELQNRSYEEIAERLVPTEQSFLEKYRPEGPLKFEVASGFGLSTELERASIAIEAASTEQLHRILVEHLLPLVVGKFSATHCTTVLIDSEEQQRRLSFAKIALLTQRYGSDRASQLAKNQNVLSHIVPHPLAALGYIGAFTIFSPWAFALPISRRDRIWLFYKEGGWSVGLGGSVGFLQQLQTAISPRSATSYTAPMKELVSIPIQDKWSYLRLAVGSIDKLLRFANDPRSFEKDDGEVDVLRQIQAMSAINLLFADLRALAVSPQSHHRVTYAFSILDKLANLKKAFSNSTSSEGEIAKSFISLRQRRAARDFFRRVEPTSADSVAKQLVACTKAFLVCHRELRYQLGSSGVYEKNRLTALRTLRNLHHGTFLDRASFEKLFLEHEGTVPSDFDSVPFILSLSAGLDPKKFFEIGSSNETP